MQRTDSILSSATLVTMIAALSAIFLYAPAEAEQRDVQRIFYLHLAMWLPTFSAFGLVGLASLMFLWKRDVRWDRLGAASAELGLVFCTLGLATGSIWAKPIWGVWWTWDPRLTLTLVLWMIYAAYLLLRTLSTDPGQGAVLSAILGATGVLDLFLINRAVYWWRGIHPAVVQTREGGSGLQDPRMQITLILTLLAFFLLFIWLLRIRLHNARMEEQLDELTDQLVTA